MQKLINAVQNYAWGSHTALTELYGIANPDNLPMAELWMGAHPKSSSQILAADGQPRSPVSYTHLTLPTICSV